MIENLVVERSAREGLCKLEYVVPALAEPSHDRSLDVLVGQEPQAVRAVSRISSSVLTACRA